MKVVGDGLCNAFTSLSFQKVACSSKIISVIDEHIAVWFKCNNGLMPVEGNGSRPYKITFPDRIVFVG